MKIVKPEDRVCLLLDFAYLPISAITARACFHHFLRNRIRGLDKNLLPFEFESWNEGNGVDFHKDQPCIRSAKDVWMLPTVAAVTDRFFRKPRKKEYNFHELCVYYKNTCQLCWEKFPRSKLTIEHVDPKSNHGTNISNNLTLTCKRCNSRKGSTTPYYDKDGRVLNGTKIPANFLFIEEKNIREEWRGFTFNK